VAFLLKRETLKKCGNVVVYILATIFGSLPFGLALLILLGYTVFWLARRMDSSPSLFFPAEQKTIVSPPGSESPKILQQLTL